MHLSITDNVTAEEKEELLTGLRAYNAQFLDLSTFGGDIGVPGTYVRPHRHPHTFELLLPLRGRFVVLNFDDRGTVTHRAILGETCTVLEMAAGTWHAVLSLDTGGIIFEVKHGGYQPVAADDYAHWAPAEGEPGTTELMAWYAQAQVGDSTFAV
ncbi:WbuC family cupin fold metalloprotein [Enterobacter hormaechei subsp. xiangfangensis]|uniref:WbuC family cupin fold metalloprotein n=1 Tax=Enterobacter cloacae complex TaxID=354276 RepID=UPI0013DEF574|nr:WbuC family cupin fold metalloprotein [Enterobacter hormaechei]MCL1419032.1 WbuC family cupin fold metalloprotein [Enterobacter hormaechei]MCL1424225.1 WbuC family cupin fold metalloprotein [Enterobacter hormaechei]MCM8490549.1 WbuC family cupin fold metalloprotein [Enterobacter hormaechei]MCW4980424.1 WbuC family cupin fold metalloprotein [Enterobacter hormaechei subsp. xiangfangensis]